MREDLTGLWQAKENGCEKARERLIERYLPLVTNTRIRHFRGASERFADELEGEGRMMLVQCVDRFDRSLRVAFPTYAIKKIWGAMQEWLRRDDPLTRNDRRQVRRGEREDVTIVSLEAWLAEEPSRDIPDAGRPVEEQVLETIERDLIRAAVGYLPRREREVLLARYWHGITHPEIGLRHGLAGSTMSLWEQNALSRLRGWLRQAGCVDG